MQYARKETAMPAKKTDSHPFRGKDRAGAAVLDAVPDGGKLAFVILQQGSAEVMYQSYTSVEKDMPARCGKAFVLILEVHDLNVIKVAVTDAEVYMPERTTFYGLREIGVKDPTGHFIIFAHF